MSEREDATNMMMAAITALPRPITSAQVREIAQAKLSAIMASQFMDWFGKNGDILLERLNGSA